MSTISWVYLGVAVVSLCLACWFLLRSSNKRFERMLLSVMAAVTKGEGETIEQAAERAMIAYKLVKSLRR